MGSNQVDLGGISSPSSATLKSSSIEVGNMENIISAPKTDTFRVRINPELRAELERIYAKNGLTLTDAVNVFFQQSLNAGGFPFPVTEDNARLVKAKALSRLEKELQKGDDCTETYDAAQTRILLGLDV